MAVGVGVGVAGFEGGGLELRHLVVVPGIGGSVLEPVGEWEPAAREHLYVIGTMNHGYAAPRPMLREAGSTLPASRSHPPQIRRAP